MAVEVPLDTSAAPVVIALPTVNLAFVVLALSTPFVAGGATGASTDMGAIVW